MRKAILAITSAAAIGSLATTSASAMPIAPPAAPPSYVDQVGWVCNPWGRCWWRPNYYRPYGYYGYRYDDDAPPTIAIDVGTVTMTVHITGAAGTAAGTTTTIDEYGGCQRAAGLAPAAHRPSLLINSGLLGRRSDIPFAENSAAQSL
jgi:hypothetical protein